ncbi:Hypothetical protein POVR1_LOCUS523 [uncultured virus]|nr:Hypothetical protein POVR1_LOCUS523 [uncultured virus]
MSNVLNIFLCIVVGIILFIAIVYSIEAARAIAAFSNYSQDPNLALAHRYLSYTSSILLIVVAALIIGIICLFIWGEELIPTFGSSIVDLVFLLVILAAIAAGVVASIAAYDISQSPALTSDDNIKDAYSKAIIAAVASLGALGFMLFVTIAIWWHRSTVARKDQQLQSSNSEKQLLVDRHRDALLQQKLRLENRHLKELQAHEASHQEQLRNLPAQERRRTRQDIKTNPSKDLTKTLANITNKKLPGMRQDLTALARSSARAVSVVE